MPSKWDTPFGYNKGNHEFPGETSSPGDYSNNPAAPLPMTGGFKVKFFEEVPKGKEAEFDSPIQYQNGPKFSQQDKADVNPTTGAAIPRPSKDFYDSPFKEVPSLKG